MRRKLFEINYDKKGVTQDAKTAAVSELAINDENANNEKDMRTKT